MRFPSPANGLDEVISCFCGHCRHAARTVGLDLDEVAGIIRNEAIDLRARDSAASENPQRRQTVAGSARYDQPEPKPIPPLSNGKHHRPCRRGSPRGCPPQSRKSRSTSFRRASPSLSARTTLRSLRYCSFAKPMTYRVAMGPAGLRLEIPELAKDVARMFGVGLKPPIAHWATRHVPAIRSRYSRADPRGKAVPLPIIAAEIETAVRAMNSVPVYLRPGISQPSRRHRYHPDDGARHGARRRVSRCSGPGDLVGSHAFADRRDPRARRRAERKPCPRGYQGTA